MGDRKTKYTIISSLIWKLLEKSGVQGVQFIIQIMLARILLPEEYGLIALSSIFIIIANVFVQTGFGTALIQKKEVEEIDYSSVFYINISVAVLLYMIIYLVAPSVSKFYNMPEMINVLRVLSLTLLIGSVNSIQLAVIARHMAFKKLFFSSIGAIVISGIVGVSMALNGFGVWALVGHQLTNHLMVTVILWFFVDWRPKRLFSLERVKVLLSFGWKLLVSTLLDRLYDNLKSLFIGKIFTTAMLGFFNRGKQFPNLIISNINGSIQSVLFPALAAEQEDRGRVKAIVRRSIVTSSFIIFPMMMGLIVTAKPMVLILLTDKWLPAVPFIQIFSVSYALWPIHTANLQAINALGRSDIFLKLEVIKKVIGVMILLISLRWSIYIIALGGVLSNIIYTFINAYPNKKLLDYSYKEQMTDILPSFIIAFIMGLLVYSVRFLNLTEGLTLLIQIPSGIIVYITLAKVLKLESFVYLIDTIKDFNMNA